MADLRTKEGVMKDGISPKVYVGKQNGYVLGFDMYPCFVT